ncbi:MAG: L-ribulose-5-phosphate 4-epimerase UlaF [Actinomycetota bacterium]
MLTEAEARIQLALLHTQLWDAGLVVWSGGNISQRIEGGFLIKPSGLAYDELTPESMVLCDLDGNALDSRLTPSSDTAAHAYVYRHMPEVSGVVHTHSNYACGWAAAGRPIPCVLTAIADEFGGEIPLGPFAVIGDDSIGRGIVETLSGHRSRAVLMKQHGVFTVGKNAKDALKAAIMCEDNAKSAYIAEQLGGGLEIPQAQVDSLFSRYQNVYGQLPNK